jgi:hypothetical protein
MSENLPARQINKGALIETIMTKLPEEEAKYLIGVLNKDISTLGSNEVFSIRNDAGEIKAFRQRLILSASDGTLIQPVPGGPFVISAQGYERWAATTGVSVAFPGTVNIDGESRPNPAVMRDPTNKRVICVYARAVAFGFTDKGLPIACDWTTFFDLPSYRLIDLIAKARQCKSAFRLLPSEAGAPSDEDSKKATWARYPFDDSTTLWVDTSHEEALTWFSQSINREKKALDFAQSFARRNALKHLSGLQKVPKAPGRQDEWELSVLCWKPTGGILQWDGSRYERLQETVDRLAGGTGAEFSEGQTVIPQVIVGKEDIDDITDGDISLEVDDAIEASSTEVIDQPQTAQTPIPDPIHDAGNPPTTPVQESHAKPKTAEHKKIEKNFQVAMSSFPAEFSDACAVLKISKDLNEYSLTQMSQIMKKINEALDQY